jgi:hypothetical protein
MDTNKFARGLHSAGEVAQLIMNQNKWISPNDGKRRFTIMSDNCHDGATPFGMNNKTMLKLTNPMHHVTDMTASFIMGSAEITVQLPQTFVDGISCDDTILNASSPNGYFNMPCGIFVGLKSSNNFISRYALWNGRRKTDCAQTEGIREGFLYSVFMSNETKNRARFAHSLWHNVHAYDNSICGAIFHYGDFKINPVVTKSFDFIIPYDDILPLQAFGYYPNSLCGQLELETYFDHQGFVYCQISPE